MRLRLLPVLFASGLALAGPPSDPPAGEGAATKEGQAIKGGVRKGDDGKAQRMATIHRRCKAMGARIETLEQELAALDAEIAALQTTAHEARGRKATDAATLALLDALIAQRARTSEITGEIAQIRILHMREHIAAGDPEAKGCPVISLAVRPDEGDEEEAPEAPEVPETTP